MAASKTLLPLFFFFFLRLSLSLSSELQTLHLKPLPQPHSSSQWAEAQAQSTSEYEEADADSESFTVELHHVDSLPSSASTAEELFSLRLKRDAHRVSTLSSLAAAATTPGNSTRRPLRSHGKDFSSSIVSGLAQGSGEYFTRLGLGTPAKNMYMVLDTGSDVVWTQCMPCRRCYTQTDPVFDPRQSHSFISIPCSSPLCHQLDQPGCTRRGNKCAYQVSYGDGSFTVGQFARETMTFRGAKVPNVALGCGHDNEGLFVGAAGLLGLGRGKLSFPSQTGRRFGQKFSYCLVDRSASAKPSAMVFGASAVETAKLRTGKINDNPNPEACKNELEDGCTRPRNRL